MASEQSPPLFGRPWLNRIGEYEMRAVGSTTGDFASFLRGSSDEQIVGFFRRIGTELNELQLQDFHFKVQNRFSYRTKTVLPGWDIVVLYGRDKEREGPLQVDQCMSCELDCPLSLGVLGTVSEGPDGDAGPLSKDSLIEQNNSARCWLDAKARPMIVVTPLKHAESMLELDDEQLLGLWKSAAWSLDQLQTDQFISMILNHGTNRNHAHLHLKIRVNQQDFDKAQESWPEDWREKLKKLQKFTGTLPEENRGTHQAYMKRQHKRIKH